MDDQVVWVVVEPMGEPLDEGSSAVAARKAQDTKARVHLLQCLPNDLLMQVTMKKTGREVWELLKVRFVGRSMSTMLGCRH